ncbi:PREDICTED: lysine-rich arabinogalactan protein 19 [Drosophila arizonae]|uniref:Lysine-rich arabinogalactan protein 19 n=1 Tax=Drosophila arizonae TaxID=7263 RepID=A0ABM1NTQ1_DROAR|nr:PREDICTED: lysine-rich arabinogalactan protein 19 [Drosophila arizonae]
MHLKLLLIVQLLAIACTQARAYDDNQTLDDVQQPETTTIAPEPAAEENAKALAAEGLQKVNDGEALINMGTALPETTNPTTTITTAATIEAEKQENSSPPPPFPQREQYFPLRPPYNPLAYPQTHPYGYGFTYIQPNLSPELKPASGKPTETPSVAANYPDYPGYPYPNFPMLRPPFSPYGSPYPQPGRLPSIPGFASGISADKPKSDAPDDSEMGKEEKTKVDPEAPKPFAEPPSFGYPPVYVVRRPLLPSYPFPRNIGGYGSPYGYGR